MAVPAAPCLQGEEVIGAPAAALHYLLYSLRFAKLLSLATHGCRDSAAHLNMLKAIACRRAGLRGNAADFKRRPDESARFRMGAVSRKGCNARND